MKFLDHSLKQENFVEPIVGKSIVKSSEVSNKVLEKSPELLNILENEKINCENLSNIMAIDKIKNFAKKIEKIGE